MRVGRVCAGGGIGLGPAAELEAAKNSWQVAVTILDSGGNLVMFHKLDDTQLASIGVSEGKANTALRFKRPSKALDDVIAAGGAGLRLLAVKDITPLEGGLPVILDGTNHRSDRRLRRALVAGRAGGEGGRSGGSEVRRARPSGRSSTGRQKFLGLARKPGNSSELQIPQSPQRPARTRLNGTALEIGKYVISDKPMTEEQWTRERATLIDVTPDDEKQS